ncbi:hypothetical protein CEXT_239001 [Caerostris extrusa]|uniref:Uncharacterized protein n=1 Tax=Caerostris extrusa TaxID=172846 RepID=A0AAV4RAS8_CAEEX|nr:hypothetical protein CEXT_239001 [Caerostris extrusa]
MAIAEPTTWRHSFGGTCLHSCRRLLNPNLSSHMLENNAASGCCMRCAVTKHPGLAGNRLLVHPLFHNGRLPKLHNTSFCWL